MQADTDLIAGVHVASHPHALRGIWRAVTALRYPLSEGMVAIFDENCGLDLLDRRFVLFGSATKASKGLRVGRDQEGYETLPEQAQGESSMTANGLSTLITFNPWAVGPTVPLEQIADQFQALQIRHVPVVDEQRRVVGMVSESDLLRHWQRQGEVVRRQAGEGTGSAALARDIMTREVLTIAPHMSLKEALALLLSRPIHALPVVENEQLVGVISSRDFLREFSYGQLPGSRQTLQELLMRRPVEGLESDTPLEEALLAMQRQGTSALPVVKGDCPLGVVTQRAIVRARHAGAGPLAADSPGGAAQRPAAMTVAQVAEASPILRPGERLCEAAAAIVQHHVSAVLVVSAGHRLLGMVTEDDLLHALYDALA